MTDKVLKTIHKYNLIKKGETLIVGISGGPDSVCLLHLLYNLKEKLNIKIYGAHINHMIRGEQSDKDQEYVKHLCEELGISLFQRNYNIKEIAFKRGISHEEAGREVRYEFFELCSQEVKADKIAVAHNKSDQAETILMNIIRGTGIDGLKGMNHCRGKVIRPLLDISREEIEMYCEEHKLKPRLDSTNLEDIYTRNRIRLNLIPYIDELFDTKVVNSIYRMSLLVRDDYDFIDYYTDEQYQQCVLKTEKDAIYLLIEQVSKRHPALIKRIIRKTIFNLKGSLKEIESIHVEDVFKLCTEGRTGSVIHLPQDIRAEKSYNVLKIFRYNHKEYIPDFEKPVIIPGTTELFEQKFLIKADIIDICCIDSNTKEKLGFIENYKNIGYNSLIQFFDYDILTMGINIRNRRNGDIFNPYKSSGTKKLKEFFIDNKIPRDIRRKIPLISLENEIVWIVGYKISDKYKVTENTKRVIKLEYIEMQL